MSSQNAYCRLLPIAAALLFGAPAIAAPNVIFVSGKGNDANACDKITLPCLTLQAGHDKAAPGGTVVIVDGGNYKPLVIKKSIAIVNESAGVADIEQTSAGADAITVSAGANDVVHLRGLSLDGAGKANAGVKLLSAGSLHIADSVARRFTNSGFLLTPGTKTTLVIDNTTSSFNANGLVIAPSSDGAITGVVENSRFVGNDGGTGLLAGGNGPVKINVFGGFASENAVGIAARGGAKLMARNATSSNNRDRGYAATDKGTILRLAHSVASGGAVGVSASGGGLVESYSDNNLRGNGLAISGAFAVVAPQ